MAQRNITFLDRLLTEADHALRTVAARPYARLPRPNAGAESALSDAEKHLSASLMRVNHSGEIAAQALYRGQALVAREPQLRSELLASADEEHDHLAWCQSRTQELGGQTSKLAPLWYAGSFALGMAAGLAGDKRSLGFLDETEKQVAQHLDSHLTRLPAADHASRKIIEQMHEDEVRHGSKARAMGGEPPPKSVRQAMRVISKLMTTVSFRV